MQQFRQGAELLQECIQNAERMHVGAPMSVSGLPRGNSVKTPLGAKVMPLSVWELMESSAVENLCNRRVGGEQHRFITSLHGSF